MAVPPPSAQALEFYRTGVPLWFLGRALSLAIPALILFTGLSSRLKRVATGRGRPWIVEVVLYAAMFVTLDFLLHLPWRYFMGFVRQHAYGLSVETWDHWRLNALKSWWVDLMPALLFLWIPYAVIRRSPRRWWLYTGLGLLPFIAFSAMLAPITIDPLFNSYGPMKDKALEARIDALARRAGIEGSQIFEVDKSRETTTVNAYVTGLFGTKRIVLWDTLLQKLEDEEVLAILGHEMGHFALNHVARGVVLASIGSLLGLYLIHRAALALIARYHLRFGFDQLSDIASVPLILMLANLTMLLSLPITNAFSRQMEHEADRFALEITRANRPAALGFVKLQEDNLSIPYPGRLSTIWRSTHPPIGERIEFCNDYRPWETGQPLVYDHLFRDP